MLHIEDKLDILPGSLKKISCVNSVSAIDKNAGRSVESVDVINRRYWVFKRIMDIVIALAALFIIAVPMLIVFLLVYIDDPGNVLFAQYRVGRGGRCFKLYKLRTMRRDTPQYMSTSEVDDPDRYITRIGRILRRLSIDELPQLLICHCAHLSVAFHHEHTAILYHPRHRSYVSFGAVCFSYDTLIICFLHKA